MRPVTSAYRPAGRKLHAMHTTRRDPNRTGIYVHFPYCIQKCHYCDFYSVGLDQLSHPGRGDGERSSAALNAGPSTTHSTQTAVVPALLNEFVESVRIEFHERIRNPRFRCFEEVNTIFFGGGTASLLPPELIAGLLDLFRSEYRFTPEIEITLEGNPENFTADYLKSLSQIGVTRVNVGLQTFQEQRLAEMHRFYNPGQYEQVLENLQRSAERSRTHGDGIANIGGDLIYGFPGQTAEDFYADLERTIAAGVNHLSIYSLTLEENTAYAGHVLKGRMAAPTESKQAEIFLELPAKLAAAGLEHYEVSNFARAGNECRHNLRYWLYESYLALGPGAHGFDGAERYGNPRSIALWKQNPAGAKSEEHVLLDDFPLGYLRLCDRLDAGVFAQVLEDEYGCAPDITQRAIAMLNEWERRGDVVRVSRDGDVPESDGTNTWRWTRDGLLRLDERVVEMCGELGE